MSGIFKTEYQFTRKKSSRKKSTKKVKTKRRLSVSDDTVVDKLHKGLNSVISRAKEITNGLLKQNPKRKSKKAAYKKRVQKKTTKKISKRKKVSSKKVVKGAKKKAVKKQVKKKQAKKSPAPKKIIPQTKMTTSTFTANKKYAGYVSQYFSKIHVAAIKLDGAFLKVGDEICFGVDSSPKKEIIKSMQVNHQSVDLARIGSEIGIKVKGVYPQGIKIYKVLKN